MANAVTANTHSASMSVRYRSLFESVIGLEKIISSAFADTFFSQKIWLGRLLAGLLLFFQTKFFIFGCLGALASEWFGRQLSKNKTLQKSRLFALNGLFVGLSTSSFLADPAKTFIAVLALALVSSLATIVCQRLLKTWDLPLLVLPYCLSFWFMQLLSHQSKIFQLTVDNQTSVIDGSVMSRLGASSLSGFGQIFFSANWHVGASVAIALTIFQPKQVAAILCSAVLPSLVAYLCLGNHWAIDSGLTSFSGILLFQAYRAGVISVSESHIWILIGLSGLLEAVTLNIGQTMGVFALSASYIAVFWIAKLSEEVKPGKKENSSAIMTW
jgi:urea transporter